MPKTVNTTKKAESTHPCQSMTVDPDNCHHHPLRFLRQQIHGPDSAGIACGCFGTHSGQSSV